MDEPIQLIAGRDDTLGRVLGMYDTPAYIRRGLQLADARKRVLRRCQTVRGDWLRWVRIHLNLLSQQVANWNDLRPYLATEQDCRILAALPAALLAESTVVATHTTTWGLRARLRALIESMERFNRRWTHFLTNIDLADVNAQVAAYNRYYLLEKECALRSARLAARGFEPARPMTHDELARQFPLLPILQRNS